MSSVNSCAVTSPSHGIVEEARMSSVNSCAVTSPSHGIVWKQGCHALIAVQYLLLSTGLWGGKDVIR